MIDTNISEGFDSAIESKNNIKQVLKKIDVISDSDIFSTYGTKLDARITEDKIKLATAITDKGVTTDPTDTIDAMVKNIGKISGGGTSDSDDDFLNQVEGSTVSTGTATSLLPFFYFAPVSRPSIVVPSIYSSVTNFSIPKVLLKNIETIQDYCFYSTKTIIIQSILCPKLKEIGKYCFYNNIQIPTIKDSFPVLNVINTSSFSGTNIEDGIVDFPSLEKIPLSSTSFCSKTKVIKWNLPKLMFGVNESSTTNYADCRFLSNNILNVEEIRLNSLYYCTYNFWELFTSTANAKIKKIVMPQTFEYRKYSDFDTAIFTTNNPAICNNLYYLHLRTTILNETAESLVLSNLSNLQYLIIGFSSKTEPKRPKGTGFSTQRDYNYTGSLRLPNLSNCGKIKAVLFQKAEQESSFDIGITITAANPLLMQDLQDETKIANFKAGLLDTENEKGYLYLADIDYNYFMRLSAKENSNMEWLQNRTRKWSEYKDLLVNEYGLDSIEDWY